MDDKLFPEFLNKGSKGPAVALLQVLLIAVGYNDKAIVADGDYGEQTAIGVRKLQNEFGLEPDGNFGPVTREAFKERFDVDVNALPASIFAGATEVVGS